MSKALRGTAQKIFGVAFKNSVVHIRTFARARAFVCVCVCVLMGSMDLPEIDLYKNGASYPKLNN